MNTDAPWRELSQVLPRVVVMPTKLDQWEWPIPAAASKRTPVVVCKPYDWFAAAPCGTTGHKTGLRDACIRTTSSHRRRCYLMAWSTTSLREADRLMRSAGVR